MTGWEKVLAFLITVLPFFGVILYLPPGQIVDNTAHEAA